MRKIITSILLLLFIYSSQAQIKWESGYYIDNTGKKITGFIENIARTTNPNRFDYKATENADAETISIENAKEFGFVQNIVYQRFTVPIDKSRSETMRLSNFRNPEFETETLYLKKLIDGKASLYLHTGFGNRKLF